MPELVLLPRPRAAADEAMPADIADLLAAHGPPSPFPVLRVRAGLEGDGGGSEHTRTEEHERRCTRFFSVQIFWRGSRGLASVADVARCPRRKVSFSPCKIS